MKPNNKPLPWLRIILWCAAGAILVLAIVLAVRGGWQLSTLLAVAAALGVAVAPTILERVVGARDQRSIETRRMAEHALTGRQGGFPLVRDLDNPYTIGVHPSLEDGDDAGTPSRLTPYVRRDASTRVVAALENGGFVLLLGESTAGKSRLAYESMRSVAADHRFIYAQTRESIGQLLYRISETRRFVLWLDDLERFLGPSGLSPVILSKILGDQDPKRIVLATMRSQEHARYSARMVTVSDTDRDVTRVGRDVLNLARVINVDRIWSPTEVGRAKEFQDDYRIAAALGHVDQFGLAEYLAAGPQLLSDWRDAWTPGTHPRGAALVAAAVDIRRAGIHRPVSPNLLLQLHEHYLSDHGGSFLRPEPFQDAMAWAMAPLHATSSLLMPGPEDTVIAFDYLADSVQRDPSSAPVPAHVWRAVVEEAGPGDEYGIGVAAFQQGHADYTRAMLQSALDASGSHAANALAYSLGASGDPQRIASSIGELVRSRTHALGPLDPQTLSARHSYAHWIGAAGDPALAATLFGDLVPDIERVEGADSEVVVAARHSLAYWVGESGHPADARDLFRKVLEDRIRVQGESDPGTFAARHSLAYWTAEAGDKSTGVQGLQTLVEDQTRVLGPEHPHTLSTKHELARSIGQAGDPVQALTLIREVYEVRQRLSGEDHVYTLAALHSLARWSGEAGDPDEAVRLLRLTVSRRTRAQSASHPDTLYARYRLGIWLRAAGEHTTSVAELQEVLSAQIRSLAPSHPDLLRTRLELGVSLAALDDLEAAVEQLRTAHSQAAAFLGPLSADAQRAESELLRVLALTGPQSE